MPTSLAVALALVFALPWLAETTPAPGLIGGPLTNGYFGIAITNGDVSTYYQIEVRDGFDVIYPWRWAATGTMGQTNFSIAIGPAKAGFFRALTCTDCDNDGIPNTQDANPFDPNIGVLSVTIQSPTNGANIY